ncbi:hypothetical protein SEA_COMRADE_54 [Streptomyces phage Comrade]|uniref:Uncharacterized protein n=3 Tax=Gilsonvirus comrade TaxID=2846395 RepID=A0A345MDY8_9CAUD|nr:hypothetical protein HWB84_gp192 [Streptomyces phage Comrade]AXH68769.1 hypothetical protein SEA_SPARKLEGODDESS_54 [Streptomyces phage SparkleGoddess]QQO39740.1 hypothetical protein SEA_BELFORT_55 [Streptomyces phage Belfort]QZE11649.1 hypothetical protein SEA_KARP_52 [Streptomyces phage Karp]UTN92309.1 hypothetical protein SEA_STIGMA_53 [Streptomyces phage Stigma]AXQ63326.1 hypothetical protein SEA_COMRADE_54 [Streptomyces phage Comrade]
MHEVESTEKTPTPHKVKVMVGYTRNMGNFESLRLDVGLEVEGYGNPNPTFDKAYGWAEGRLLAHLDELESEIKGIKEKYED